MGVITTINVGGADYRIQDAEAREQANTAINLSKERTLDPGAYFGYGSQANADNTYAFDMPNNYPFQWNSWNASTIPSNYPDYLCRGGLLRTTRAVRKGEKIIPGTNCASQTLSDHLDLIRVYVGSDSKLHYRDWLGADSVLNFSGGLTDLTKITQTDTHIEHQDLFTVSNKTLTASGNYNGSLVFIFTCTSTYYEDQMVSISSYSGLSNVKSDIWMPQMGIATGVASGNYSFSANFANSANKPCGVYVFK